MEVCAICEREMDLTQDITVTVECCNPGCGSGMYHDECYQDHKSNINGFFRKHGPTAGQKGTNMSKLILCPVGKYQGGKYLVDSVACSGSCNGKIMNARSVRPIKPPKAPMPQLSRPPPKPKAAAPKPVPKPAAPKPPAPKPNPPTVFRAAVAPVTAGASVAARLRGTSTGVPVAPSCIPGFDIVEKAPPKPRRAKAKAAEQVPAPTGKPAAAAAAAVSKVKLSQQSTTWVTSVGRFEQLLGLDTGAGEDEDEDLEELEQGSMYSAPSTPALSYDACYGSSTAAPAEGGVGADAYAYEAEGGVGAAGQDSWHQYGGFGGYDLAAQDQQNDEYTAAQLAYVEQQAAQAKADAEYAQQLAQYEQALAEAAAADAASVQLPEGGWEGVWPVVEAPAEPSEDGDGEELQELLALLGVGV